MNSTSPPWESLRSLPRTSQKINLFQQAIKLETLERAWQRVRANRGCAGSDGVTTDRFELRGHQRLLGLAQKLADGRYRPKALRLFDIPKSGGETRRLAVPAVIDRVAQTAVAEVLGQVIEPVLDDASFAYRPGRSVKKAVLAIKRHREAGFTEVVEGDIERYFDRVPQEKLLDKLDALIAPMAGGPALLDLIALWLEAAGVDQATPGFGVPQGSPLSPLLSNLYLDLVDEHFADAKPPLRLVRYADDFVILAKKEDAAEQALELMAAKLAEHGLRLHPEKTRIVDFDKGFRFLGHLFVRSMILKSEYEDDDSTDEADQLLRWIAGEDQRDTDEEADQAEQEAGGLDPGLRILYLLEPGRFLTTRQMAFVVEERGIDRVRELLAVPADQLDRIEVGPASVIEEEALRLAFSTDTVIHHVNGQGDTLAITSTPASDHAALHLAQARIMLDDGLRLDLARRLVDGRIRNQRAQLHRLNRAKKDKAVIKATKDLGMTIRKLPIAGDVPALLGYEGSAGAIYWPALAKMARPGWATAKGKFKRQRHPAADPLNVVLNYLAWLLTRDVEVLIKRHGLHPGFGALHSATDGQDAAVYDLMEIFRAPLAEGLAVYLFNNRVLDRGMFTEGEVDEPGAPGGTRLCRHGHGAIIAGYQERAADQVVSQRTGRRLSWRRLIQEEAVAYARHCRAAGVGAAALVPYRMDY